MNDFLNGRRLTGWCRILAVMMALWAVLSIAQAALGGKGAGKDLAADFTCYFSAGRLVRQGTPAAVYAPEKLSAAEHVDRTLPAGSFFPFYYPPPYLLLCLPLAFLPYWPALILFSAVGLVPLIVALRRLLPANVSLLPALAFPGVLVTAGTGQNGFFTAACFGWFAVLADARPWLAGGCLGLLACKPQLAVLAPVALIAAGRWRSLAGAAVTFAVLSVVSVALFGLAPWAGFLASAGRAGTTISGGMADQTKIQSTFIAARLLGGGLTLAAVVQGVVTLAAVTVLLRFVRPRPGAQAEGAALAAAALLATPYLADYDLVCLAPPLAVALTRGSVVGWGRWDKLLLLAAYLTPLLSRGIAGRTDLQLAPLAIAGLFFVLTRKMGSGAATRKLAAQVGPSLVRGQGPWLSCP
jgi:alpha-1,2-mannosyltransferase